jgi:hypothetical protein
MIRAPSPRVERFRDSVSSLFSTPVVAMERMGQAVTDPGGFFKEFAKRYDSYWQRRRGGSGARGRGRPQYRSAEGPELTEDTVAEQVGPLLPSTHPGGAGPGGAAGPGPGPWAVREAGGARGALG